MCLIFVDVQPFYERHGLRSFMIAATAIIKGTGISFCIKVENVEGATGYYDSNLDGKARRTVEMIT
jgi:2,3-bisphosphoglycerate-independent phosphoglycerate mutase